MTRKIAPRITANTTPAFAPLDGWLAGGVAPFGVCAGGWLEILGSARAASETKFLSTEYTPCAWWAAKLTDASVPASPRAIALLPASNREPTTIA